MTSRDFCYWLQGYIELDPLRRGSQQLELSAEQAVCIRNHLALVFKHEIDPGMGGLQLQQQLNDIHNQQAYCGLDNSGAQKLKAAEEFHKQQQSWQKPPTDGGGLVRC